VADHRSCPSFRGPRPTDSDHPSGLTQNQPDQADSACSGLSRFRDGEKAVFNVFGIVLFFYPDISHSTFAWFDRRAFRAGVQRPPETKFQSLASDRNQR
jgi:hypothetical protein